MTGLWEVPEIPDWEALSFLPGWKSEFLFLLENLSSCSCYLHEVVWFFGCCIFVGFFPSILIRMRILSFVFSLCSRNNIILMPQKGRSSEELLPAPLTIAVHEKLRKGSNLLYFTRVKNIFVFMFSFKFAQNLREKQRNC